MNQYTYLMIDLACLSIPLLASFYPKRPFYLEWRYFIPANLMVSLIFLIWDYLFTEYGIWYFNPDYILGIYLFNLPIEEILFFFCIPYACVFTYFAVKHLIKANFIDKIQRGITIISLTVFFIIGILNHSLLYTSVTFLLTAAFLLGCLLYRINLKYVYLSYTIIMPFFFLSNGLLTGTFIEDSIVSYNDHENLGIRLLTIPVEDMVYGFLLIGMNILIYEALKNNKNYSLSY